MLTQAQKDEYERVGAIVVPEVLSAEEVAELRSVTDGFVERARGVATHDAIYDLEDSHSAGRAARAPHQGAAPAPRGLRPAGAPSADRRRAAGSVGPDIRFDTAKLNMKSAGFGAAVEWHQDWAFYPHTNDDLAAVGVMMDDIDLENGPLLVIPGSHRGPVFDHHADGRFCGAMDPSRREVDYARGRAAAPARPARSPSTTCARSTARRPTPRPASGACCCSSSAPPTPGRCSASRDGLAKYDALMVGRHAEHRAAARGGAGAPAAAAGGPARLDLREPEGPEEQVLRRARGRRGAIAAGEACRSASCTGGGPPWPPRLLRRSPPHRASRAPPGPTAGALACRLSRRRRHGRAGAPHRLPP